MVDREYNDEEGFKVRLEARVRNGALINAREELGMTQKGLSEEIEIRANMYSNIERMQYYPSREIQEKICQYFRKKGVFLLEEEVFPEELKKVKSGKQIIEKEIPRQQLISLDEVNLRLLPYVEGEVEQNERYERIGDVLDTLTEKEKKVIELRFGFEGNRPRTLKEVAEIFNLTSERIRRIEIETLGKMGLGVRKRMLKEVLD